MHLTHVCSVGSCIDIKIFEYIKVFLIVLVEKKHYYSVTSPHTPLQVLSHKLIFYSNGIFDIRNIISDLTAWLSASVVETEVSCTTNPSKQQ